jgi:phosphohistidine phosphatase
MNAPRLVLVARHAHADWPAWQGRDFDRPLTPRGEEDAARTAEALREAGHRPGLVLVSPALRTRQTAGIIARRLGLAEGVLRPVDSLYNASPAVLEAELRQAAQETDGLLMLVAHNPGVSQLARSLSGDPAEPAFSPADWRLLPLR